MKNFITISAFLLGLFFTTLTPLVVKSQIYSASGGGLWTSGATWVGGIVPGAADNVVIVSTVSANGNACNNIHVATGGVLQNYIANNYSLTVNGYLINDGTISNNTIYYFSLSVKGNISNTGVFSNNTLTLNGSGNQQIASTQPISVGSLIKNNTSGRVIATSGLNFVGTMITLNSDTLQFTTGNSLIMTGGYISTGVLYKAALPALQITTDNGAYLYLLTIDAPQTELNGEIFIYSTNNFKSNVINNGILQNYNANTYTLTVSGNFTNNGTVQNNSYNLNMNISGNLINNGTWTNYITTLNGSGNQEISMTQPFQGSSLIKNASSGRLRTTTDLSFIGTEISLNSDTLEFTTGSSITLNGGFLNSGVLYKSALPSFIITTNNEAYLNLMNVNAPQIELYGTLLIYNTNNFKGNVINYGTLHNRPLNNFTLNLNGNFINNGTVQNNAYYFYLNISGSLANNGSWTNYSTILNGNSNQELSLTQPFEGSILTRNAAPGRVKAITDLSFIGTTITLNDTLEFTTGSSITLNGGSLNSGVLYKSALPSFKITTNNEAYLYLVIVNAPQVELYGTILIYSTNSFKGHIINYGTLQNSPINNFTLNITGDLINNGIIQNNVYYFYLNISGNLANNGSWTNNSTTLNGNGSQELSMTQPFGCSILTRNAAAGRIKAITDLSFIGTTITLNDTIEFVIGNSISLNGGSLNSGVLYKSALPALTINSGSGVYLYIMTVDAPQMELYGNLLIYGTINFKGNVINYGTLQNRSFNSYILNVTGNFTNIGIVKNNVYTLNLNISGNVTNNGSWKNDQTTLIGTNTHILAFTNRFEGSYLTNGNAAGNIIATTDIIFDGTTLDMNNCSFTLNTGGRLSVLNGSLTDVVIFGTDIHFHSVDAYCVGVVFDDDVTLSGVLEVGSGVSFNGSIINDGIMRNLSYNSYGIHVQGGLVNHGSILNNVYGFIITVLGDIHNSGVWSNSVTILDGASNQYIYLINNRPIQGEIRLEANFSGSGFNWYGPSGILAGNPAFSGVTTQILGFLNPVNSSMYGRYYCLNSQSISSRSIYINPQLLPAINLTVRLEGFYTGGGLMRTSLDVNGNTVFNPSISDQITVELHAASNFANIILSDPQVYLYTDGSAYVIMPTLSAGSYYLAVKHRNSIETVSSVPIVISGTEVVYNFDAPSKAYGNNLILLSDGSYAVYGGDVNQDGIVDIADMTPVDNGSSSFQKGYMPSDANGDGVIDTGDMTIVDNNSTQFVSSVIP